ncbi:MAG: hypothetical protein JWO13_342 [Acidobacteriales bacterium]|nr:hypothetical protein [Terriglobales bacterium]
MRDSGSEPSVRQARRILAAEVPFRSRLPTGNKMAGAYFSPEIFLRRPFCPSPKTLKTIGRSSPLWGGPISNLKKNIASPRRVELWCAYRNPLWTPALAAGKKMPFVAL